MTPVVLTIALAVVAAFAVIVVAGLLTGTRLPGPRELVAAVRAALGRGRETFMADDDLDGAAGNAADVFAVGEPEPEDAPLLVDVLAGPHGRDRGR